jgi:uncharacterized protein (DUF1499 family)
MKFSTVLTFICSIFLMSCTGSKPDNIGFNSGRLAPCPSSPNCVSTRAEDAEHKMDPISYKGESAKAVKKLVKVIKSMEGARIIEASGSYIRAEYTSATWKFVDDVEFYIDDKNKVIHFRSASRLGYSDLGVNRKRMEDVTVLFNKNE